MDPITRPMGPMSSLTSSPSAPPVQGDRDDALRQAAQDLEASFLTEMLKAAGVGKPRESFGGGVGEDQFGSFLIRAQAKEMVKAGGIGLAESLFEVLKERADGSL